MAFALAVQVPNPPLFCGTGTGDQSSSSSPSSPSSSSYSGSSSLSTSPTTPLSPLRVARETATMAGGPLGKKRPARLDIPLVTGFSGEFGSGTCRRKVEEKVVMEDEGDGFYSVCCKRGRRGYMEDRYSAFVDVHGDSATQAFFGVYDGHGGTKAANFASKNLARNVMAELSSVRCEKGIEMAVRNGYSATDMEFLNESVDGGACCVTACIHDNNLVVSNAGDCRAVMSRGGAAVALTSDHHPSRPDEKHRIEVLGGYVDCCKGVWRIQGSLAVTRGIGDRHLKQWVISEPETKILKIDPECEFLVLASDGLWDKVCNQEAVDIVRPLCIGVDKADPFSACKKLTELAALRGSMDDISVMVILLRRFIPLLTI